MRTLYRPVGLRELELILDADARAFPPRLPDQRDPRGQLRALGALDRAALSQEAERGWQRVLANHGFWSACAPAQQGLSEAQAAEALGALREAWARRHADLPLPPGTLVSMS